MNASHIDTPIATVQRTGDLVEVRFKVDATLTVAGIMSIMQVRERLAAGKALKILIVFPQSEMDFEMSMITTDHYTAMPVQQFTRAVAWAAINDHNERFCKLYFAYFPSPVPSAIFMTEEEARTWLESK